MRGRPFYFEIILSVLVNFTARKILAIIERILFLSDEEVIHRPS